MNFNFDEAVDRRRTNSIKHDFAEKRGMPADVLPLWVADMDFRTVPEVTEALVKAARHGIFGYSDSLPSYTEAVLGWYRTRFGWNPEPDWLVKTSGVVYAIATAVRAFTRQGEAVLIQPPVYHPFASVVRLNERVLVNNPLVCENGSYHIDFDDFEAKIAQHRVKLFVLCSPHNPVGRVWTRDELSRLGDICLKHGVRVVSDEIHSDFVHAGHVHTVLAGLSPDLARTTVTCTAPSKTFNLAGLQGSNIFIADPEDRRAFRKEMERSGSMELNSMALVACEAAYRHGAAWLEELKAYLAGNIGFVRDFLARRIPRIRLVEPQGTYLLWLDCRGLGLSEEARQELIVRKARLWLDAGTMFGPEGEGFERVNVACPGATLETAFNRLEAAVREAGLL